MVGATAPMYSMSSSDSSAAAHKVVLFIELPLELCDSHAVAGAARSAVVLWQLVALHEHSWRDLALASAITTVVGPCRTQWRTCLGPFCQLLRQVWELQEIAHHGDMCRHLRRQPVSSTGPQDACL